MDEKRDETTARTDAQRNYQYGGDETGRYRDYFDAVNGRQVREYFDPDTNAWSATRTGPVTERARRSVMDQPSRGAATIERTPDTARADTGIFEYPPDQPTGAVYDDSPPDQGSRETFAPLPEIHASELHPDAHNAVVRRVNALVKNAGLETSEE